jgi:hypothetical protein
MKMVRLLPEMGVLKDAVYAFHSSEKTSPENFGC